MFKFMLIFFFLLTSCFEEVKNSANSTIISDNTQGGGSLNQGEGFDQVQVILQTQCGACHGNWAGNFDKMVNFSGDDRSCNGCDSVRVTPGDLEASSLYQSLLGDVSGTEISQMPPTGTSLSNEDIDTISTWILSLSSVEQEQLEVKKEVRLVMESNAVTSNEFNNFRAIILNKCSWCHKAGGSYKGIDDYESLDTPLKWVESGFIIPANANNSKIVRAINGNGLEKMPQGNLPQLSNSEVNQVNLWINSLPENSTSTTLGNAGAQARFDAARAVLASKCVSCHSSNVQNGGVRVDYLSESDFLNLNLVIKGNAIGSRLFRDIRGANVTGGENDMPRDNRGISAAEVQTIRVWIDQMP